MTIRLTVLALLLGTASPALAGPFADVGDARLRQDVDMMKAAGLIRGPVDSWPLPWAQIEQGLNAANDGRVLDPYLAAAVARVDRLSEFAAQAHSVEIDTRATTGVAVARSFDDTARSKFDSSGKIEYNNDIVSVAVGAGVRSNQGGHAYHFEPSQIAIRLDNWALYGGFTQEWFGPGHDGALLFSNSSAPFPKIGVKRLIPDPINLPVLRWLGPVRLDFFVGMLNEKRDYRNTLVIGTRLSFEPVRGWEIGFNRAQQLCGKGRACGTHQIVNSFIGAGNADNVAPGQPGFLLQAGNQIAGYDMSYVRRFRNGVSAKIYFEVEAEDSQHILIEQYSRQIGTTLNGPWGVKGASWQFTLEYADTLATELFNGTPLERALKSRRRYPTSMYNNGIYTSGFTFRSLPIGYWTDGDSRNLSAAFSVTDTRNRRWYGEIRSVHLNISNLGNPPIINNLNPFGPVPVSYRVSANSEKLAILTGGVNLPTQFGDVKLEARYQTDSPNTPGVRDPRFQFEVGLTQRF